MSDAFLLMRCDCGYSCWSLKPKVICPECGKENEACVRESSTSKINRILGLESESNE